MTISRRITALNKQGVVNLQCGRFREAIFCFRHALDCFRRATSLDVKAMLVADPLRQSFSSQEIQIFSAPLDCVPLSLIMAVSPHNCLDVYQTAFLLSRLPESGLAVHIKEISILLSYNIALAHHLMGLSSEGD